MPVSFAHTLGNASRPSGVTAPAGVSFLPAYRNARQDATAVPLFIGPIVRAVVWYGNRALSLTGRFFDQNTRLGRLFIQLFGPFSVPTQTKRAIALDVISEIIGDAFGHFARHELLEYAKHQAIEYYEGFGQRLPDGNASVVFIPEANPGIDILKWDP